MKEGVINLGIIKSAVLDKINHLRRKMLVHSYLYYALDSSIVDDITFDRWAKELVLLQKEYPSEASQCVYNESFKLFDGTTGFNLERDAWVESAARRLLQTHKELEKKNG